MVKEVPEKPEAAALAAIETINGIFRVLFEQISDPMETWLASSTSRKSYHNQNTFIIPLNRGK